MRRMGFQEAADVVKASLDIVDIISRQVVLKKAGRNFLGLCPFHPEKTASFNVNREKNLFKCFGCGEAGDALAFVMRRENKTYGEVIRDLASEQGIEILSEHQDPEAFSKQQDVKQKIFSLNATSQQWFAANLKGADGEQARQYLSERHITPELMDTFGLGVARPGWDHLTQHLQAQVDFVKTAPEILVESGLSNPRQEGNGYYDRFRNRLIIPIYDEQGRIVGFGGRAFSAEDKPKYLNSPETPVYVKSRVLYGLHQAKEFIRQQKFAVVMEGYFDVIAAHWGGVPQAVGSCGTALTESHLKLLTRFGAETVYLAFDSDEAGLKAAMSAIELIEPYVHSSGLSLKIVIVPSGKDPDDFIHQAGGEAFRQLMKDAQSFLDFKFTFMLRDTDLRTPEGRVMAANRITPLLANIRQPVLRSELLNRYADRLRISQEALALEVKRYERAHQPYRENHFKEFQNSSKKKAISNDPRRSYKRPTQTGSFSSKMENIAELRKPLSPKHIAAEKSLLQLIFLNTESYHTMFPLLESISLTHGPHQLLVDAVRRLAEPPESLEVLLKKLGDAMMGQSELFRLYADTVLSAESLMQQLQLEDLSVEPFRARIRHEADTCIGILSDYRKQEALRQLVKQSRSLEEQLEEQGPPASGFLPSDADYDASNELSLLELQYQIRDTLSKGRKS